MERQRRRKKKKLAREKAATLERAAASARFCDLLIPVSMRGQRVVSTTISPSIIFLASASISALSSSPTCWVMLWSP